MEIYLVRHGIAEDASAAEATGKPDSQRRLTSEGREKTGRVAQAFRKRVGPVPLILHSPYLRAKETAEIFAVEFHEAKVCSAPGLTPVDRVRETLLMLGRFTHESRMMVVGHEPHLSALASLMLTGREGEILEFRKAGIACIEWDPHHGSRLLALLPPKFLL